MVGAATGLRKFVAKPALALASGAMLAVLATAAQARVTKIVIDTKVSPAPLPNPPREGMGGTAAITGSAAKHSAAEMIKSFIAWPFGRSADYGFAM